MQQLSKQSLSNNQQFVFDLPVKVLQFGTGVLLRGLCDYIIDKANEAEKFNGRIAVVKSTAGNADDFAAQDGLYTVAVRGVQKGQTIDQIHTLGVISRVISAHDNWQAILAIARNPHIEIVISNTTEVGITYVEESIFQSPPQSFPAKLTAFLYERFRTFGGKKDKGLVVIPTELITDNGLKLRECVEKVATHNELGKLFSKWLKYHVKFCNSLVDRIVPGKPDAETHAMLENRAGYKDSLLTVAEPYYLWAIEGDERVRKVLSFAENDPNVIIEEDISYYRERKLRILNGSHSVGAPSGFLSGFDTVYQCTQDAAMSNLYKKVVFENIVPTLKPLFEDQASEIEPFASEILDRYSNPFIQHKLIGITLQQTSKMQARNVPTILRYYENTGEVPQWFALGFASHLLFMRATREENGQYFGQRNGNEEYPINDDAADFFYQQWQQDLALATLVNNVLSNQSLWLTDLTQLPNFAETVTEYLTQMLDKGVKTVLNEVVLG